MTSGARARLASPVLGMALFVTSEIMFFGALLGAYFALRAAAPQWPTEGTPHLDVARTALFSVALVSSSFTQHASVGALRRGDSGRFVRLTLLTVGLGTLFLAGQAWEYAELASQGFTVSSNVFGTAFYTLTGFHGLHVAGGLTMLALTASRVRSRPSSGLAGTAEAVGLYWHFVDAVWIALFGVLYLLG